MTATPNKARKFSDAATELGWTVTKKKDDDGTLYANCRRGDEQYNLAWEPGERGLVFAGGWHWIGEDAQEITSATVALKDMAKPAGKRTRENGKTVRLPFDPKTSTDEEIIESIKGRTITWQRTLDGETDEAQVPPYTTPGDKPIHAEGKNTKIRTTRWLEFDSPSGMRTIDVNKIVGVA